MKESIRRLWPYLWRYRRGFGLGLAALILKDFAAALQPLVIGRGVDSLTHGFALNKVLGFAGVLIGLSAIKGLFQFWMRVILIGASRDIEYDLRNDLFRHLITLSSDFYSRFRTGDIMARATNDLNAVRMMLGPGIMYWTETMFTFIIAVAVMAWVDWPLTLVALVPAPLISGVVIIFGRIIHERFEEIQKMFSDISSRVQENLAGVRVIRAYVQEEPELERFETLNREYIAENIKLARTSGLFMPLLQALIGIDVSAGPLDRRHALAEPTASRSVRFVMFNTYMGMLVWPMIALGWVVNLMQRGSASLSRIWELLGEQPAIAAPAEPGAADARCAARSSFAASRWNIRTGLALANVSICGSRRAPRWPSSDTRAAARARWST